MFAEPATPSAELLHQTAYAQPALFAMGVAMHAVFVAAGITPDYLLGHSIGELTAAHIAGVLCLSDAAVLVSARGRLMQACPSGAMIAIQANEESVLAVLKDHPTTSIAAVNGPTSVTVSGPADELDRIRDYCAAHDLRVTSLAVSHAFHSSYMDPALPEFEAITAGLTWAAPTVPIVSNLTGQIATAEQLTSSDYWTRHLREPVRFYDGVAHVLAQGDHTFLELSPHPVLAPAITDALAGVAHRAQSAVVTTLHRDRPGVEAVCAAVAHLHNHGCSPSWRALYPAAEVISLPTYAFQHRSYWSQTTPTPTAEVSGLADGALWKAVDEDAVDAVAEVLGITDVHDAASLGSVVRALREWRSDLEVRSVVNALRYRVGWKKVTVNTFPPDRRRWLVLASPEQSDDVWITGLSARYAGAIEVLTVDPREMTRDSLSGFLIDAAARTYCDGIVSFMAVDERPDPNLPGISVGLWATLLVTQAHCDADLGIPLWVLTQGGVSVSTDDGLASPSQAAVWGLGQSACLEYPEQWGGLIDLPSSAAPQDIEQLHAILACPQSEDQLAIRRQGVSARRLFEAPVPLERLDRARVWKPSGTALVTGATGRLGGHVVQWLAQAGAVDHLVLLSRTAADHPQTAELERELGARGIVTTSVSVDITDRAALAAVLAEIRGAHGPIQTVVHAAAAIERNTISETTAEEFVAAYAAKATGADNLAELLEDEPPATLILFSSAAGTWGGARQGPTAAANAHIDALAERLRNKGWTAVSAAFGFWAEQTDNLPPESLNYFQRLGINPIPPKTALTALQQAIETNDTLITIADVSWDRFLPAFTAHRAHPLLAELAAYADTPATNTSLSTAHAEGLRAQLAGQTDEQQLQTLTTLVRTTTATVLAHPDPQALDINLAFKDLGIDSLTALELRNGLAQSTGLTLAPTLIFDQPTPAALARHLQAVLTDTTKQTCGPIGQLVEGAGGKHEFETLINILIATSSLPAKDSGNGTSSNGITSIDLTAVEKASVHLVCLSEFHGQYCSFAAGVPKGIQVTEILAPGFSGTSLPPTMEQAAQEVIDVLRSMSSSHSLVVVVGHGATCILGSRVIEQLRNEVNAYIANPPKLATAFIAPLQAKGSWNDNAGPLVFQAVGRHLQSESSLIAYGWYLRSGTQSYQAQEATSSLTVHPRTGHNVETPSSPLVLEPAYTALKICNWVDELDES